MGRIITLTTDFGLADEFVGVIKGVILAREPTARLVDLSHQIVAHDIRQAAFLLAAAWGFFPGGTIHLAVVDPGVGSARRLVLVETGGQFFLAPDNGLLSLVLGPGVLARAWRVDNRDLFPGPVAATFHGRDILAPVAARLAAGLNPELVGPALAVAELIRLPDLEPLVDRPAGTVAGRIEQVDRFGNLVTNIRSTLLPEVFGAGRGGLLICCGAGEVRGLVATYADVAVGGAAAVSGGRGFLELVVNQGRAADYFRAGTGASVLVRII
ncbi:MAG: SAM-dependent chlorinase/fluorinase [Desulfobulbaceae bacterium]|nr:SAM-dependent chlorinase/fluorinase [Desulfobulbaceae bacterium]